MMTDEKGHDVKRAVTINDIAQALALSRNTVSRALNGYPDIPESTRLRVMECATRMNYKSFARLGGPAGKDQKEKKELMLFSKWDLLGNSLFMNVISSLNDEIAPRGGTLTMHVMRKDEIENCVIPSGVINKSISGIVIMELFDRPYLQALLKTGIPAVFFDSLYDLYSLSGNYDVVMQRNEDYIRLIGKMIDSGKTEFGFIGSPVHCRGFYERWHCLCDVLRDRGIEQNPKQSILFMGYQFGMDNIDFLVRRLSDMKKMPQVFVCANDFMAMDCLAALHRIGKRVPEDVLVTGFDDVREARLSSPALSTVHVPVHQIGRQMAKVLYERMEEPDIPNRTVYLGGEICLRESTGNIRL